VSMAVPRLNEAAAPVVANGEFEWGNAVHRVVTEGITPEQAVDDAIVRIKQILAE
jgi:hypothetical protein